LRIAVVGAGVVGGIIGAKLARAGEDVVLVARGEHLEAMRTRGLQVRSGEGGFRVPVRATDDCAAVGQADVVISTLKAHQISGMARAIDGMCGPETHVAFLQNGIPWWFFHGHGGRHEGLQLRTVDPDGRLRSTFDPDRTIGGMVRVSGKRVAPGVIEHGHGSRLDLAHPSGVVSPRLERVARTLSAAGVEAPMSGSLREKIWTKIASTASLGPASAAAGKSYGDLLADRIEEQRVRAIMGEMRAVAGELGITVGDTIDERIAVARQMGGHESSMLQDVRAGRPLELCTVEAPIELAGIIGVPVPNTQEAFFRVRSLDDRIRLRNENVAP
jgi:2-dehydropantoate 2-reductase